jgi:hypothetical protein
MKINIDTDSLSVSIEDMNENQFERMLEIVNELTTPESDGDF